jgi:hypothetical protein
MPRKKEFMTFGSVEEGEMPIIVSGRGCRLRGKCNDKKESGKNDTATT